MSHSEAEQKIEALCDLFNVMADIAFRRENKEWYVSLRGVGLCGETGSTIRYQSGRVEKVLAGSSSLSATGRTLQEAIEKIEARTVAKAGGFVVSNQEFGMFCGGDEEGAHIVSVYEGTTKVESFPYDQERLRAAVRKYNPA